MPLKQTVTGGLAYVKKPAAKLDTVKPKMPPKMKSMYIGYIGDLDYVYDQIAVATLNQQLGAKGVAGTKYRGRVLNSTEEAIKERIRQRIEDIHTDSVNNVMTDMLV